MMKASLLSSVIPSADLGEGPCWDQENGFLYWVDITGQAVHRYDPIHQSHEICNTPAMVGFAIPESNGNLIVGLKDGIYRLNFKSAEITKIAAPYPMPADNRFNDGKCDRAGRLWCGTMNIDPDHPHPTGQLYRLDKNCLTTQETDIFISNGLGWSPDNRTMYYTDTVRRVIWQYDYDIETGNAVNRRIFLQKDGEGRPDGLCVDSMGRVFTALWPGWGIEIYTPDGKLDGRIELPVPQVSSCAFGGADLKTLFITTARIGMNRDEIESAPLSGSVFAIDMDIPGLPEAACRVGV